MSKSRNIADLGSNDVLETTATGVDVTGTVAADGLTVDGGVFELQPNESKSLSDLQGKHIFVSDGDITSPAVTSKHGLISFESINTAVVTAGSSGAVVVLFYKRS